MAVLTTRIAFAISLDKPSVTIMFWRELSLTRS